MKMDPGLVDCPFRLGGCATRGGMQRNGSPAEAALLRNPQPVTDASVEWCSTIEGSGGSVRSPASFPPAERGPPPPPPASRRSHHRVGDGKAETGSVPLVGGPVKAVEQMRALPGR